VPRALRTSFSWALFRNPLRVGYVFYGCFYGCVTVLQTWIILTDFYRKLYGHGIQSFLLCVLSIAMSVPSVPTAGCSVALSLYTVLPIALTIVHSDGTSILSLHNRYPLVHPMANTKYIAPATCLESSMSGSAEAVRTRWSRVECLLWWIRV
jgi:hypothetical protein